MERVQERLGKKPEQRGTKASALPGSWPVSLSRWDFGDGTHETYQFKPPYNGSFLIPDPSVHEVVIEQSASHTYEEPGKSCPVSWGKRSAFFFVAWRFQCQGLQDVPKRRPREINSEVCSG